MEDANVGNAIRAARLRSGLTTRALAGRLGLSPATISAIETGKTGVAVARLRHIATALDTTPTALLSAAGDDDSEAADADGECVYQPARAEGDWRSFPAAPLDPVLTGAVDAFVEKGYHGTTMRDLAQRIGLSVPGIYHHYRDKQQLLVRILDMTMTELHWRIAAARGQARTSLEEVAFIVEALALFHTYERKLAFIGSSEMRSLSAQNLGRIARSRNRLQHILDDSIERAVADGYLHTAEPRAAGRAIATMCTALPQWFRPHGPWRPEQIARTYVDFALLMLHANQVPSTGPSY